MFLEISQNSQENTCARIIFNKVADLRPATLLKRRLWHRCFPVNFVKFLKTPPGDCFCEGTCIHTIFQPVHNPSLHFLFVFCFVVFLEIQHLILFWIHFEFHEIKLNAMKYALNCVSWNSLKELFHSVSSPCYNIRPGNPRTTDPPTTNPPNNLI